MKPPFPEFVPQKDEPSKEVTSESPPAFFPDDEVDAVPISRLRDVPFRMLVPNLITLGAICSGLSAIRFGFEGRFEFAVIAILFAAVLDGLDGRVARFLKSSSSFGEQLDSLADFVNFGVAPALVIYMWTLKDAKAFGWIVALIFAICGCLRLARFNVMLEDSDQPKWYVDFFTGVPAPAGALLVLLPVYLGLVGVTNDMATTVLTAIYVLFVGFLMVSNLPTWSGKRAGQSISSNLVLPVMIGLLMLVIFLFSFPWEFLILGSVAYLATLPFSIRQWNARTAADKKADHSAASAKDGGDESLS